MSSAFAVSGNSWNVKILVFFCDLSVVVDFTLEFTNSVLGLGGMMVIHDGSGSEAMMDGAIE